MRGEKDLVILFTYPHVQVLYVSHNIRVLYWLLCSTFTIMIYTLYITLLYSWHRVLLAKVLPQCRPVFLKVLDCVVYWYITNKGKVGPRAGWKSSSTFQAMSSRIQRTVLKGKSGPTKTSALATDQNGRLKRCRVRRWGTCAWLIEQGDLPHLTISIFAWLLIAVAAVTGIDSWN